MRTLHLLLFATFFTITTTSATCTKEEEANDQDNVLETGFNLCISFDDPALDDFDPFNTNSAIQNHLSELPYYTSSYTYQNNDHIEVSFSNFILIEDAYNETTQTADVLYHLIYEGRGHVEAITLDCVGNNVTESFLEHADQAVIASGEYHQNETKYIKYRYYIGEE